MKKNKIKFFDYSINKIEKQYVKISTKKKFLSSLRFFQRFLKETISTEDIPISELNQGEHKNEDLENEILEVSIGFDIWMVKNLNVERFRNGDLIPKIESNEDWEEAGLNKQPVWCYYDNTKNGENLWKII